MKTLRAFPRAIALLPLRVYRRLVSPLLPQRCRYYPSCSRYAVDAVERYGVLRGSVLAAWRVLRCNPWSAGGIDQIDDQTVFTTREPSPAP